MITEPIKKKLHLPRNIFYGWWIAIVSSSVDSLKHGTFNKGFTSYIIPMGNELGITLSAISFAERRFSQAETCRASSLTARAVIQS